VEARGRGVVSFGARLRMAKECGRTWREAEAPREGDLRRHDGRSCMLKPRLECSVEARGRGVVSFGAETTGGSGMWQDVA